jgi:hypothetical protein
MRDLPYDMNEQPDWDSLNDDELIDTARRLVGLTNAAGYELAKRKYWVLFEGKARGTSPRRHEPQKVDMQVWKEVMG